METEIKLISFTYSKNDYNQQTKQEKKTAVFAKIKSVGSNEFHRAGMTGLKPKFVAEIHSCEYHDEKLVEVDGCRYSVYRTYLNKNKNIELYLDERNGANG